MKKEKKVGMRITRITHKHMEKTWRGENINMFSFISERKRGEQITTTTMMMMIFGGNTKRCKRHHPGKHAEYALRFYTTVLQNGKNDFSFVVRFLTPFN